MKIGVLALQGAFREHRQMLEKLGVDVTEVRLPKHLEGLSGLVIPGGESTTMGKLMMDYDLKEPIQKFYQDGGAIFGTCAGAIMLATEIEGQPKHIQGKQPSLELMDITVARNAFGRQVDSFKEPLTIKGLDSSFDAVFIRAPVITQVGEEVEVLCEHQGQVVLARSGRLMAASFHPELTRDARVHELFLKTCVKA